MLAKYNLPDYNSAALSHQKVFAKLYPDKPKTGTNLHQLMSELIKLLKRFWAVTTFENETCLQNDLLLDRLLKKIISNCLSLFLPKPMKISKTLAVLIICTIATA